jgi:lipopolysaccharide assembly protein A
MQNILWLLRWILKAAIFFTLFAFALNNQHEVAAHFFFGNEWKAPLVVIVLIAFTAGLIIGVLGMVPRWWRQRQTSQQLHLQMQGHLPQPPSQSPQAPLQRAQDGVA